MASIGRRYPTNAPGRFYVDQECTDCDVCRSAAPAVFVRHAEGYSYVVRQPSSQEELLIVESAMEVCPVQAIGSDGG